MTDAREPTAVPALRWQRLALYTAPALVLLAVVVPFLSFHEYDLLLPESLILIGGAAALGSAIGALSRVRRQTLGPMLMALTLCVYIFYRQEVTDALVVMANAIAGTTGYAAIALAILGVALFLAIALVCLTVRQHLDSIVAAVFATIVLSTVVLPTETGGEPVEAGALPKVLRSLPPVVHIILDEHIGLAGLPAGLEEAAAAGEAMQEVYKDFALYGRAYSRFAETKYALTSLMNRDIGADVGKMLESDLYKFAPTENAWFDLLKKKGYAIKVYQSAWFDMCGAHGAVDACYTYSFFSPNAIQRAPLSTGQRLRALALKLFMGRGTLQLEPLVGMEALDRFRSDIAAVPRGVAYIVHVLIPHFGYLYADDCALLDPSQWERERFGEDQAYSPAERISLYRRYLSQLACATRQMDLLFAELKRLGVYDEATIIVHGDHGSRIAEKPFLTEMPQTLNGQDMIDHFATLLAIKAPGVAAGIRAEPAALQHVFAETFLGGSRSGGPNPDEVFIRIDDEEDRFAALEFVWRDAAAPHQVEHLAGEPDLASTRNFLGDLRR